MSGSWQRHEDGVQFGIFDTDVASAKVPPLKLLLKRLARGHYGIVSGNPASNFVRDFLVDCQWAARTGRVVDIGTMDYKLSKKSAQSGLSMLRGGHFRHPFDSTWCTTACDTFDPASSPERTFVFHRPEDGCFAEGFISGEGHVVLWYVVRAEDDGTCEVVQDDCYWAKVEGGSYAAAFNTMLAAVAVCNTRGIRFTKEDPVSNKRGKGVAGVYRFQTGEYFTALGKSGKHRPEEGSGRRSPIPHVRRAHARHMANGEIKWIHEALVNVRSEHELAFTETKRVAYVRDRRTA